MALTQDQDLPLKPQPEKEGWTYRRLFPMKATVSAIAKAFVSPLEVLLAYVVFIIGIAVLIGRVVPVLCYILAILLIIAVAVERARAPKVLPPPAKETKEKK